MAFEAAWIKNSVYSVHDIMSELIKICNHTSSVYCAAQYAAANEAVDCQIASDLWQITDDTCVICAWSHFISKTCITLLLSKNACKAYSFICHSVMANQPDLD